MSRKLNEIQRYRSRKWWMTGATLVTVAVFGVIFVAASGAVLTGSTFEGDDGNLVVNTAGHTDWASLGYPGHAGSPTVEVSVDTASGSNDNSFTSGTHEDDPNVTIAQGSIPPNKNDLTRSYVASETVGSSTFLYLAWERLVNTGSANLDFELNQNATSGWDESTIGDLTINRTAGDLLVTYDFGGSGTPTIGLLTWVTSGADSQCFASGGKVPCWGNRVDMTAAGFAEAGVNTAIVNDPILGADVGVGLFGEASINLSSALVAGGFNPDTCEQFGSQFVKSRSSGSSINAELKDFIAPTPIHISNCASPTISTTLSASSAFVGDTVHDSSTLTGATATAGGSVTYSVYTDDACTQGAQSAGTKTVTNGVVPDSNGIQFNSTGTFYWQAAYGGDNHNNAAKSPCLSEILTVGKHSPTIATTLSATTGAIGATVHDSSALTGATATAGGSVTYTVYTNDTCTLGAQSAGTKTVTNGVVPDSNAIQFNSAGDFYWQAVYTGDAANNGATSVCTDEHLVISKNSPTIATTLSATTGAIGDTVHDSSALTGATATAGGSVTYTVYTNNTCTQGAQSAGTKTVTNHLVPDSDGVQFNSAGDFYWQAVYTGDSNNNGATSVCTEEHLVIGKNSPTIATTLSATTAAIGDTVHDSSALTGATATAGGSVTYTVYTNSTCTQGAQSAGTKTVANHLVPDSNGIQFNSAGDFYWQAVYTGDANNNGATSVCLEEHLVVAKNSPTIATTLSATTGAIGDTVHDSSALTGATATAGGSVTYTVYTNNTCTLGAQSAGTKTVTNHLVPDSNGVQFNTAGDFYWQAVYTGDANNNGATSVCTEEHLVIGKNSPTIATTLSETNASIGDTVHDSSALTGATATAGGSVTYTVYTNDTCTLGAQSAGTKTVTNGVVPDSNGIQFNSAGDFYWQAVYTGDANNGAATSVCTEEHLVIGKNSPTIATTLSATTAAIGDTVHDSSALTGATTTAGGSVTYTVYTNDTCTLGAQTAGTKTVTNHLVPDSNGVQFNSAGDFYWQAVYTGDANNNGATSVCTEEHLVIEKNSPSIATLLSDEEVLVGASVNDSATLTGATSDAGGTATYSYYTNDTCTLNPVEVSTADVTDGDVGDSDAVKFDTAGNFYWQVVYSGDANNNGATSPCNSENNEHLLVDNPSISITKNPKSQAIDSGATATFTITVTNTGTTTLTNVAVTDAQAPGCAKAIGTLTAGQSTSYTCSLANVTSSFTNSATATGHPPVGPDVTATDTAPVTVNAIPPPPPPPPAPPAPTIDLSITKSGSPNPATLGNQITWTMTVRNAGPSPATGVKVADPVPAGTTFVSATSSAGTCTGGAVVNCSLGNMAVGATVTVTLVTTSTATGTIPNTATVVGNEAETNTANNTATASVTVNGPFVPPVKYCTAVSVAPKKTLFVGRKTTLTLKITQNGKAVKGIRIKIKGAKLAITTAPSNAKGIVKVTFKPTRAGIVTFAPVSSTSCANPRIGVTGVFTPPVTG